MAAKKKQTALEKQKSMICDELSFMGQEAYKQLRTNIIFSLPAGDTRCKVIAVTSPDPQDGKSTTSINLAYTLAATKAKVLLIEGDMRAPVVAKRLDLKAAPGLSNLLIGRCNAKQSLQTTTTSEPFVVITAGDVPPNPSELLTSHLMETYINSFKDLFDYIIWDLPPVNTFTDAASVADKVDGYILVTKQNKSSMRDIEAAVQKLKIVKGKILGFVLNGVSTSSHRYGYSYYNQK